LSLHKKWLESDGAEGKHANLRDAYLRGANLRDANLRGANLRGADLQSANLRDADLQGANLRYANLQGANLQGANLRDANLQSADMRYANLRAADLQGANLQGANLDFSVWPLWCGSFDVKCDIRLACQLAYHFCRLECDDAEVKDAQNALLGLANRFRRVEECGVLEPKQTTKLSNSKKEGRKGKVNK
jgi:uncharacterized protein YjbI with pentapeptide repeats